MIQATRESKDSNLNSKAATLLFFWDYDTQWGADRSRNVGGAKNWGHLEFENTERLMELHAEYDVPACFAVVGAAALPGKRPYHDPAQIRQIHGQGHEIGSHAFRHEWLPGLGRHELLETLSHSKDSLEQCVGAPVVTFVPPYNQPFDYPAGWAFSLTERRQVGRERTDLGGLCSALDEVGYRFCRVAYRPVILQLVERLLKRRLDRPCELQMIGNITCARLNTPGGFDVSAVKMLERHSSRGGVIVVYGHPHSLRSGNSQDEAWLLPFLRHVKSLKKEGRIQVRLPRDLIQAN